MHADWLTEWGMLKSAGMLYACKGAHILFTGQRERDKDWEREREREKERKREREKERKTEREKERKREREKEIER